MDEILLNVLRIAASILALICVLFFSLRHIIELKVMEYEKRMTEKMEKNNDIITDSIDALKESAVEINSRMLSMELRLDNLEHNVRVLHADGDIAIGIE